MLTNQKPDPRADVVARQYERYRYPQPIEDLGGWLANNWQWFDPVHAHRVFWPDRPYRPDLDILIAGCGTNQAAVFAYNNRDAKVLGVDVSQPSLDHEQYLKDKYVLENLELRHLPIEELPALGRDFDLVVSTGVLHHLADPPVGMRALARCLRVDGAMGIMLYAKRGRIGVEWLQSVFRDLALGQNAASVQAVREVLAILPPDHPVRGYLKLESNLASDAVLVDTFLHGRERSYTVDDCVDFVITAGLAFQGWFFNASYYPHALDCAVLRAVDALPNRQKWAAMERLYPQNACHFFMACHPDRPRTSYAIDFASPSCLDDVPVFRMRCGLDGGSVHRPGWQMALRADQLAYAQRIDGQRSLRAIAASVAGDGATAGTIAAHQTSARDLFESLWRFDFVAMTRRIRPDGFEQPVP